jgi:hypothetical protein
MENKIISRVLNERAFAQTVGLSYAKVKQLRQRGIIKYFCRVGRRILYKNPEHVTQFLEQFARAGVRRSGRRGLSIVLCFASSE